MKPLTPQQKRVLSYVVSRQKKDGSPPTVREISAHFGYKSPNNARQHLELIERKGYIRHIPGKARGIDVVIGLVPENIAGTETRVPIIGRVAAGLPVLAEENHEGYVTLDRTIFRGEGLFTLRVNGDSMQNAGILDGDLAIVKQQSDVDNGQIAVVIIDGEATLKRFFKHNDRVILRAENPKYGDMIFFSNNDVWVVGKMVGIIRKT